MTAPEQGWYPDPHDPQSLRWWDGTQWTEHTHAALEQEQQRAAPPSTPGNGPLWMEPELVVTQRHQAREAPAHFEFAMADGRVAGTFLETTPKTEEVLPDRHYRLTDSRDTELLTFFRLGEKNMKPQLDVLHGGQTVASFRAETHGIFSRDRIGLFAGEQRVGEQRVGELKGTEWQGQDYAVSDETGTEVGQIKYKELDVAGLKNHAQRDIRAALQEHAEAPDTYRLQRLVRLPEPLATLTLLAPVAVDLVFRDSS